MLPRILGFAHELVRQVVHEGDIAIDATVGNGHDTLFLAECVGETGHVWGLDVQQQALHATQKRLQEAGVVNRVSLTLLGHEHLEEHLHNEHILPNKTPISAILFNLGYLPHGDPSIKTHTNTTLSALSQAIRLVKHKGLVSVVLYPCHEGGDAEADAVLNYAKMLPSSHYQVAWYQLLNKQNAPPSLLLIERTRL